MLITVLADDVPVPGFCSEFGLSLLLESAGVRYLFDTGGGTALVPNLQKLGIATETLDKVVLSHGHGDHTGGLASLDPRKIWCCPGIESPHYSRHADGTVHDISMPEASRKVLQKAEVCRADRFQPLDGEWFLTGPIPRISGEDCGGDFYHDGDCTDRDSVPEEQALLGQNGVLLTGCCHAGIMNTIEFCRRECPGVPVRTIVGGLHLRSASEERLHRTARFLAQTGVRRMFLMHCTGEGAVAYLRSALPECSVTVPVPGQTFEV